MSLSLSAQLEQLAQSRSASITDWVAAKKSATASIKPSVVLENPKSFARMAELAGGFTQTYIGYPDKHAIFSQDPARATEYDPTQLPRKALHLQQKMFTLEGKNDGNVPRRSSQISLTMRAYEPVDDRVGFIFSPAV
ncbi:hypothetical protein [Pantoea cypripedii]|uniref:Uncharacterized protein n=1 Tax=Pantoea cypripedii TaxID=55209 RepID=A0A6B9GHM4_PANCY|nr:hypothetical protein [Pantoea cypripedii]QGY32936.1 hypothetical protein CUN67_28815 [Pantoea cypripedii]